MSKFSVKVRMRGNGVHVGISVKHWQDFAGALKAAAVEVSSRVMTAKMRRHQPTPPPAARPEVEAHQLTDEELAKMDALDLIENPEESGSAYFGHNHVDEELL